MLNTILFYIFSIIALAFLVFIICKVKKIADIKFDKKEKVAIIVAIIVSAIIYAVLLFTRKYIYQWDNSIYYFNQLNLLDKFNFGFLSGIKEIISTTYRSDYGDFLLSFTSGIFSLTNKTPNAFVMTYYAVGIVPVIIIFTMIVKKIISIFEEKEIDLNKKDINLKRNHSILYIAILMISTLPILHKASIMGQPDVMGLIFIGLIILLTIDYDFSTKDRKRCFYIILLTALLLITRRWYMFWALGYFLTYAVLVIIKAIISSKKTDKDQSKSTWKNIIEFAIIAIIILGIAISPIIYRTLKNNYQSSYGAWLEGGTFAEIGFQIYKLGILFTAVMVIGILYGCFHKGKIRSLTIQTFFSWLIALAAFTRIQNMGDHHSLLLVPTYIILFTIGIIAINNINKKAIRYILDLLLILILIGNMYISILKNVFTNIKPFIDKLFSNVILRVDDRTDLDNIKQMTDFIITNCDKENKAYINAGSGAYNNTTFSNVYLPNYLELNEILPYSLSIDAVHGFPKDVLTSKYVFTSNITLSDYSADNGGTVIPKINYAIMNDAIISKNFTKVNEFKMTDKITFYAYERINAIDSSERNEWLQIFKEQSEKYPNLFIDRINN